MCVPETFIFPVGNIGKHNKTLPLIHVDKTHSGVYTCTVTGSSKLMHVSLLVSHEPHVSAAHYSVSQAIGLSIQLDCEVNTYIRTIRDCSRVAKTVARV